MSQKRLRENDVSTLLSLPIRKRSTTIKNIIEENKLRVFDQKKIEFQFEWDADIIYPFSQENGFETNWDLIFLIFVEQLFLYNDNNFWIGRLKDCDQNNPTKFKEFLMKKGHQLLLVCQYHEFFGKECFEIIKKYLHKYEILSVIIEFETKNSVSDFYNIVYSDITYLKNNKDNLQFYVGNNNIIPVDWIQLGILRRAFDEGNENLVTRLLDHFSIDQIAEEIFNV